MKIRVKRSCIEETLLLVLFGFYVLVAHWIWFGRGIQETIMICLSILVILKSIKLKKISVNILPNSILWGTLFLICGFGFVRAKTHQYLVAGLKAMFGTIIISIAVVTSIRKLMASGYDLVDYLFEFLNRYFILNDVLIVIQYFVP